MAAAILELNYSVLLTRNRKDRPLPLVLEDKPGHVTHTGQPEGGISGSGVGMTYFVLVKEGPHFTALPVKDWYNFRPTTRNQAMSLEEAEKQMNSRGAVRLNASSKLGALAAKAEAEGAEVLEGDEDGEKPDSDEERETQRVARLRAANADAAAKDQAAGDADEDMPSAKVHTDAQEKGEDWEHEEERADDDLEQGEEEASDQDAPTTGKKERILTKEGDSDGEGHKLSNSQQELRRVLRKTHLSSGSEDGGGPSSSGRSTEDDDDDDDVDLDEIASDLLPKAKTQGQSPGLKGRPAEQPKKAGEKRKAATPPVKADAKKARPGVKAEGGQPVVKQEVKQEGSTQSEATSGPPSAREILDALKAWGPVTTGELTSRFRKRLATPQDKQAFMGNVKRVSKLEERPPGSGRKFVVPK